jgi:hypothetical protein
MMADVEDRAGALRGVQSQRPLPKSVFSQSVVTGAEHPKQQEALPCSYGFAIA